MTTLNSIMPTWFIEGETSSLGYFQDMASMPVPGDHVVMFPGEEDEFEVVVTHRTFEQPERSRPLVRIHAKRVVPTVAIEQDQAQRLQTAVRKLKRQIDGWQQAYTGTSPVDDEVQKLMGDLEYTIDETLGEDW